MTAAATAASAITATNTTARRIVQPTTMTVKRTRLVAMDNVDYDAALTPTLKYWYSVRVGGLNCAYARVDFAYCMYPHTLSIDVRLFRGNDPTSAS